jgi:hypothetical protein
MKSLLTLLLCSIFSIASYSQTEINPFEFMIMEGSWAGTFTYIDESSHKPTTQEFDSEVSINFQAGEIYWKKIFYPDYTVQKDTIYFTDFTFNDIDIVSSTKLSDGSWVLVTEESSNKEDVAKLRNTYTLTKNFLSFRQDELFEGDLEFRIKNEYILDRK